MDGAEVLALLNVVADEVGTALREVTDWGPSGRRVGQYAADLVADDVALRGLRTAGFGVLSEESGLEGADRDVVVVVDPLDGSTNASRRFPWYATSLCAVDSNGPLAAVVLNQARGTRYEATRGGGARRDGVALRGGSGCTDVAASIVAMSGYPPRRFGWGQYRAPGAAALDLCLVADGTFDAFLDVDDAHGVWDYAGALLVCREAGVPMVDAYDRELVVLDPSARRNPVAAATPALLDDLVVTRRSFDD
jgi:fructose-1,6-bisphosphatase/inositol monophosphatase family enzyme